MIINSQFDGGNIQVLDSSDPTDIQLAIRQDNQSDFYQWFCFRVSQVRGRDCRYRITNAAGAAYPQGWQGYRVVASYDRENWFRIDTRYENSELVFELSAVIDQVWFAYFAPYSMERHADLVSYALANGDCRLQVAGQSLDGQNIDCLHFGEDAPGKQSIWMIARQHPGETMAEWWMDGLIRRLCQHDDPVVRAMLDRAVLHLVPNMNPDGSRRGHLRTNAVGANLNREWAAPSAGRSPEVLHVLHLMQATGVDLALDVHGDESIPANFIAGTEGVPSWNAARQQRLDLFKQTLARLNPDFQTTLGYPPNPTGSANLGFCSNQLAETFGCPAMTLEMPFKDASNNPEPLQGWSPARCARLASSCLDTLHLVWDKLMMQD